MTSIIFYLHPRKIKLNFLPSHVADAVDVVVVREHILSFPVRVAFSVQHFARCKLKADEKISHRSSGCLYAFGWFAPPLSQGTVGRVVGGSRGI